MKKKRILIFIAALITVFCFTSGNTCYALDEDAQGVLSPVSGDALDTHASIKVWFGANEQENSVMETIAERFTKKTGISVEIVSRRSIFDAPADLANYAKLDNKPDIIYMQAPDIGRLVASGFLLPLDVDDDLRSRFVDTALDAFALDGQYYGVGYNVSTSGLIYNRNLIGDDELPKTWDEFFSLAESLTVTNEKGEFIQRGTLLNVRNMWFVYPIIREFGGYYYGQYSDGTYNAYDVGIDNAGMLVYVEKMKQLKDKGLVLPTQVASESNIVSEFGEGKVAMILYGLWSADYIKDMGIDYGIAPLPAHGDGTTSKPLTTVEGFVINNYSSYPDEAKAFLRYILEDGNQQALIEAGNGGELKTGARNPANISVIKSDYMQDDAILSVLSEIGMDCEPFPNIPEGMIWYNYATTSFGNIFYGDSAGKEVDAAKALKELADAIRRDVALMNQTTERVDIAWWIYLIIGLIIAACVTVIALWKRNRNKKNPLYVKHQYKRGISLLSWGLMLPLLLLLGLFYIYPIVHNIYISMTDYSGIHMNEFGFVGFANYRDIFSTGIDGLVSMVIWTVFFATAVVGLSFILGTFVATVLEKVGFMVAKIYRAIYILPWVIPTVITLLMWQGLLETDGGLVNQILNFVGLPSIPWLSNPVWAKLSTILVMVWLSFPYFMVIAFGMLKSISKDCYEAARIDGASNMCVFTKITLPLIFKTMVPTLIMGFIMQFNQFGIYLLTQGGPASDTLSAPGATDLLITYIFNTAFNTRRYAVAAAYSVILFIFIGLFALIVMGRNKKRMER